VRFVIVTSLPEAVAGYLAAGVLGRAIREGAIECEVCDLRTYGSGRHRTIDDAPYGGGNGMVLQVGPLVAAIESAGADRHVVLASPAGRRFDRDIAHRWAEAGRDLVLVCGRYEGVDHRILEWVDEEISLGDFVMTGGELAALAMVDAVARLLPGVLGNAGSAVHESFEEGALEHPQYTRPADYRGHRVPDVLLSGDHGRIEAWRREQALALTRARRPDLLGSAGAPARSPRPPSRGRAEPATIGAPEERHPAPEDPEKIGSDA
jgi:tRNA (guanine37-N1)-methyltransferase